MVARLTANCCDTGPTRQRGLLPFGGVQPRRADRHRWWRSTPRLLGGGCARSCPPPRHARREAVSGSGMVFDHRRQERQVVQHRGVARARARARRARRVDIEYVEPSEGNDRETALRSFAAQVTSTSSSAWASSSAPTSSSSRRSSRTCEFAGHRLLARPEHSPILPNLAAPAVSRAGGQLPRRRDRRARVAHARTVGFVGGMKMPLIRKFEVGIRGRRRGHVCPTCSRARRSYAGTDPKAFSDAPRGQQLGAALYDEGADVIFTAAGKTGDGVFAVARQRGTCSRSASTPTSTTMAPCCIVTSMVKRGDVGGRRHHQGRRSPSTGFVGGVHELGLAEHGVGFVADERNRTAAAARRRAARPRKLADRDRRGRASRCRSQ